MIDTTLPVLSLGYVTGETCNRNGCTGKIDEHEAEESCRCHIHPPCSICVDSRAYCETCGWDGYEEQQNIS